MLKVMKKVLQFIDTHPRIILLLAWPVLTLLAVGVVLIVWKGGWLVLPAVQLKQLDILGAALVGILAIMGLNQLAQSSSFFGKLALKLGNLFDLSADMDGHAEAPPAVPAPKVDEPKKDPPK